MIKKRTIIVLCILIVLLAAAFYIINKWDSLSNIVGMDNDDKSVCLYNGDPDAISEITVNIPGESYTLVRNNDGDWHIKGQENIAVDNTAANSLAVEVSVINAYQLIEKNASDLSVYGLDNSEYSFSAKTGEETITFVRGDETPVGSYFYFKNAESNDVYSQYSSKCTSVFKSLSEYIPGIEE